MNRPIRDSRSPPSIPSKPSRHWTQNVLECCCSFGVEGLRQISILGGADNGQFSWINKIQHTQIDYYNCPRLQTNSIILELQGQKVAGYTLRDTLDWLNQVSRNGQPVLFKTVQVGMYTL